MTRLRIYTALVTFERTTSDTPILPPEAQGACGYMAVAAPEEDGVVDAIQIALSEAELRLVAVNEITERTLENFPDDLDDHLAGNVRSWEANKHTVWGTIHVYLADGEA